MLRLLGLLVALHAATARAQDPIDAALDRVAAGAAWPRALLLESARTAAGVDEAWPRTPALGAGATVCLVDTGVDLEHAAFRDEAGRTRAHWVLDLGRAPLGLHPGLEARFGGAVLDAADVQARLGSGDPSLVDRHGHGTAIAGAALGDDASIEAAPGAYAGVAPRASLVVVRALRPGLPGLLDEDVLAGARFCAEVLERETAVLLFALGGHDGAHDGTEPLEAGLRALAEDGWVVVVAAGNEGDRAIHAGGTVSPDEGGVIELFVPDPGPRAARVVVSLRGRGRLVVETPEGTRVALVEGSSITSGAVTIDARSIRARYVALRGGAETPLRGGTYRLHFSGDVDAWITDHDLEDALVAPHFDGPFVQPAETVAIPATEPSVIAVGASVSRAAWASETGGPGLSVEPEELTLRAPFSARGPAASGWARPDLLAPGALVRTVLSGSIEPGPTALFADEAALARFRRGEGVVLAGTSVSAAIVAGAIALARAEVPGLSPDEERAALSVSAHDPLGEGDPATLALDVAAYLDARSARGAVASATRSTLSLARTAVRPRLGEVSATVRVRDDDRRGVETDVELRAGERVLARGVSTGGLFRALLPPLSGDVGTSVTIEARAGGAPIATRALRLSPDERAADVVPVGGCQAGQPRGSRPLLFAFVVLALTRIAPIVLASRLARRAPPNR